MLKHTPRISTGVSNEMPKKLTQGDFIPQAEVIVFNSALLYQMCETFPNFVVNFVPIYMNVNHLMLTE